MASLYKNGNFIGGIQVKINQTPADIYGGMLIILGLFILFSLIGAGISDNPIITIIFLMVGVILLFALNLVANNGLKTIF